MATNTSEVDPTINLSTEKDTTVTEKQTVAEKRLETTMNTVDRYLLNSRKRPSETMRDRATRLTDASEEVRAILTTHGTV